MTSQKKQLFKTETEHGSHTVIVGVVIVKSDGLVCVEHDEHVEHVEPDHPRVVLCLESVLAMIAR